MKKKFIGLSAVLIAAMLLPCAANATETEDEYVNLMGVHYGYVEKVVEPEITLNINL